MTTINTLGLAEWLQKHSIPEPNSGCVLWLGCVSRGYGYASWRGGKYRAHRLAWYARHGGLTEGLVLDHVCRTRSCINTDHLREVTLRQNTLENSLSVSALNRAKTTCNRLHPLSGDNLLLQRRTDGSVMRRCRTCLRAATSRYDRSERGRLRNQRRMKERAK